MSSAHVLSIQALEEFKGHLTRFNAQAQEILNATEIEIRRTLDWLHERLNYWRNEVNRRREIYHRALAAYQRCLESRRMRDKNGNVIQLPCPAEEAALERARLHLAEAEAELRTVQEWTRLVERQAEEYHRQAQRLKAWLDGELPKANAFLERKITTLQSYVAMGISSGGYAVTPPTLAVGEASAALSSATPVPVVQDIPLDQINWEDVGALGEADYRKVTREEVQQGLLKLEQVVRPAVQQGACGDDFSRMDAEQNLDYAHGYRCIYDAFYGPNECIVVEKVGDRYQVINGRHRLLLARELGLSSLPMRVLD
jgi:hypothetical protein